LIAHERRDLGVAIIYSIVIGLLSLAVPVAVQALVNTIAFGTILQPLVLLAILVLGALSIEAVLQILRVCVVEMIQRRVFVRLAGEVADRLIRVRIEAFDQVHGPELVNRFLDAVTVQKSVAVLVVDGLSIAMQALVGLILLAVYHPILLAFDVVLILLIAVILFGLGRGAIRTSIDESKTKYDLVAWLEELARHRTTFRSRHGDAYARESTNTMALAYLRNRSAHFRVLLRQAAGSYGLQALATSALLGIGGYLVINAQLTLGQLIAAELVVGTVVGGFAKFNKSLESFYDLAAALDKLGHLQDLPTERLSGDHVAFPSAPATVHLRNVSFAFPGQRELFTTPALDFAAGSKIAIHGGGGTGKSTLLDLLYGLRTATTGTLELDSVDYRDLRLDELRTQIALVRDIEIFPGTVIDNVRLSLEADTFAVRQAIKQAGLLEVIAALPDGLNTRLSTGGAPLTPSQAMRLMVARALLSRPRVLLLDEVLDQIEDLKVRGILVETLFAADSLFTAVLTTERPEIWPLCDRVFVLRNGSLEEEHLQLARPPERAASQDD
jgi:ABC-type bacteriocin/lantibiotic exporter with double-glycine peptidase domain